MVRSAVGRGQVDGLEGAAGRHHEGTDVVREGLGQGIGQEVGLDDLLGLEQAGRRDPVDGLGRRRQDVQRLVRMVEEQRVGLVAVGDAPQLAQGRQRLRAGVGRASLRRRPRGPA